LLGSAAVYAFALRVGGGRGGARLGAAAFLLAPIVVLQTGTQVNDLAAGALLMSAVALAAAPVTAWSSYRLAAVGLALGLAVTTKLAALPAVVAVAGYVIVAGRRQPRTLVPVVLAGLIAVAPWWIRNLVLFGNPIFPAALPLVGRGYVVGDFVRKDNWFVPSPLAWPVYPLVEPHSDMSGFGAVFAAVALVGLVVAVVRRRRLGPLLLYGVIVVVAVPAWWRLTQHEPRLLLGVFGLGFAFVGWALGAVPRERRRVAVAITAGGGRLLGAGDAGPGAAPAGPRSVGTGRVLRSGLEHRFSGGGPAGRRAAAKSHRVRSAQLCQRLPPARTLPWRQLYVVDGDLPTDSIVAVMHRSGIRYAYLPAGPDAAEAVSRMYPASRFELVRQSAGSGEKLEDVRRYLFRLRSP
jgi:hypothetical protein